MLTTVITGQPVTAKTRFKDSSWITIGWNWVTNLIGLAAEPVLTVAMVFSCYELIPNAPQPPDAINNAFFVCQFVALDFGGLALGKMAKRAGLGWQSFPRVVSMILIAITLVTMTYSGIQHVWPDINANLTKGVEATLVIMRAIMTVLYSKAIHDLVPHEEQVQGATLQGQPQGGASPQVQEVQALQAEVQALTRQVQALREVQGAEVQALTRQVQALVQAREEQRVQVQGGAMSEVQEQISEIYDHLIEVQEGASMQMLPTVMGVQEGAIPLVQGAIELNTPRQSRGNVRRASASDGVQGASSESLVQGAMVQGVQSEGASSEGMVQQASRVEGQQASDEEGQRATGNGQHNTEPLHLPVDLQVQGATPPGFRETIFAYVLEQVQSTGKDPSVKEIQIGVRCGERTAKSYRAAAIAKAREVVSCAG